MNDFEEKKEQVKELTDIIAEIGRYVTLKKEGRNFLGLCPFHSEKTGSFTVSPDKNIFHCFGCGAGGDVFKFLMDIDGKEFMDVLKPLAAACGVDLPAAGEEESTATPRLPRKAE
ncbi:MAG: DNA primase, partial [Thermodesulfovibrionia bacterium]|nr:DNA primase [Thermodesulfovibrionia bacterium]